MVWHKFNCILVWHDIPYPVAAQQQKFVGCIPCDRCHIRCSSHLLLISRQVCPIFVLKVGKWAWHCQVTAYPTHFNKPPCTLNSGCFAGIRRLVVDRAKVNTSCSGQYRTRVTAVCNNDVGWRNERRDARRATVILAGCKSGKCIRRRWGGGGGGEGEWIEYLHTLLNSLVAIKFASPLTVFSS